MFEPMTEVVELTSRWGWVGSIQLWDPWKSRTSEAHMKWWVSKIASISYGNEEAKNPDNLFRKVSFEHHHLGCLEHVPYIIGGPDIPMGAMPHFSMRPVIAEQVRKGLTEIPKWVEFSEFTAENGARFYPAITALVTGPIPVLRQWFRHRSLAIQDNTIDTGMEPWALNEMSRRYVKDSKVPFEFYGEEHDELLASIYREAIVNYNALIDRGCPPELARNVIPIGCMSTAYISAYNADWEWFAHLRSDSHAMPEIRVFSDFISKFLSGEVPCQR